jgi:hypothetical protein
MSPRPLIRPWVLSDAHATEEYDAFIAAVGFERRSRGVAEFLKPKAKKLLACAFSDRKVLNYDENMAWYLDNGYAVTDRGDEGFRAWLEDNLTGLSGQDGRPLRLAIDISSLSRFRLAVIVDWLRKRGGENSAIADFLYSVADFSPPAMADAPNVHVGPVLKSFAGWSLNPNQSTVAIVGLGYEENKALGAVEHLQVSQVWLFAPRSSIREYEVELERANGILFESVSRENRIDYRVEQPFDCFVALESLTDRCLRSSRVVLLPFGPKVFALCSLLVACIHENAAVWRVSAGGAEPAVDRIPSKFFCGLTAEFGPKEVSRQEMPDD